MCFFLLREEYMNIVNSNADMDSKSDEEKNLIKDVA